jgi:hypothetical protein
MRPTCVIWFFVRVDQVSDNITVLWRYVSMLTMIDKV